MRPGNAGIAGLVLAALAAGGCAAPAPSHGPSVAARGDLETGAYVGNQGGSWEVVLPGGSTGPLLASGPEFSRRDAELIHAAPNVVEDSSWPDPRAPRLERYRRIFLTGNPREVGYFRAWPPPPYAPYPTRYWGW